MERGTTWEDKKEGEEGQEKDTRGQYQSQAMFQSSSVLLEYFVKSPYE